MIRSRLELETLSVLDSRDNRLHHRTTMQPKLFNSIYLIFLKENTRKLTAVKQILRANCPKLASNGFDLKASKEGKRENFR